MLYKRYINVIGIMLSCYISDASAASKLRELPANKDDEDHADEKGMRL